MVTLKLPDDHFVYGIKNK